MSLGAAFIFALSFALRFPWILARWVLIPLGLPRVTHGFLLHTSDVVFKLDRPGSAALGAAWSLARQKTLDVETAEWLEGEIARSEPLLGAGIFASGLLSSARGDQATARQVIESVLGLHESICPREVRRLASAWLAADAASRGEWLRAAELGLAFDQGGRSAWLLSGVAQCLLLEPLAPGRIGLWIRWILAPHRRATLPIVQRAIAALDGTFVSPEGDEPRRIVIETDAGDPFATALLLHAAAVGREGGEVSAEELRTLGHAWDVALGDPAIQRSVAERALTIGAPSFDVALTRLRASVEDDLLTLVLAAGLPLTALGTRGGIAERLRVSLRDRLLSEVEAASDALSRRCEQKRALPAIDEWREWIRLVAEYEKGVRLCGDDFRRLCFSKVNPDACSLAVWLYNERKQRPIANAMFRFLFAEAEAVGDARAAALHAKNIACGI